MSLWKTDQKIKKKKKAISLTKIPKVGQAIKKRRTAIENKTEKNLINWNNEKEQLEKKLPTLTRRRDFLLRKDTAERIENLRIMIDKAERGEEVRSFNIKIQPFEEQLNRITTKKRKRKSLVKNGVIVQRTRNETPTIDDENYDYNTVEMELLTEIEMAPALPLYSINGDFCHRCQVPMVIMCVESVFVCPRCKLTRAYVQSTSSRIAYGEDVEFSSFLYKRSNHFQEWISQFQAKESAIIPDNVMAIIMDELLRRNIRLKQIDAKLVRSVLKDLKFRKYYEHTFQITSKLTGYYPHRMTPTEETQIKLMFSAIQSPFEEFCPKERRNFLSYSYCLFKFCELLGLDYFLDSFSLLKGRDKLQKQDDIFKKICESLDWEFIPSQSLH